MTRNLPPPRRGQRLCNSLLVAQPKGLSDGVLYLVRSHRHKKCKKKEKSPPYISNIHQKILPLRRKTDVAFVVQWIERPSPKGQIRVRFSTEVHLFRLICRYLSFYLIKAFLFAQHLHITLSVHFVQFLIFQIQNFLIQRLNSQPYLSKW